jgi:hypothetical protein
MTSAVLFTILLTSTSCRGPFGPIAGRKLAGRLNDQVVTDWSFANRFPYMQIEVRPADPYSVNINFYVVGLRLYIEAGHRAWSRWRRLFRNDPRVRVRFGEVVYERRAHPVSDPAEIAAILPVYFEKDRVNPPADCDSAWSVSTSLPDEVEFLRLDPR